MSLLASLSDDSNTVALEDYQLFEGYFGTRSVSSKPYIPLPNEENTDRNSQSETRDASKIIFILLPFSWRNAPKPVRRFGCALQVGTVQTTKPTKPARKETLPRSTLKRAIPMLHRKCLGNL
jgi:hypothetical protein